MVENKYMVRSICVDTNTHEVLAMANDYDGFPHLVSLGYAVNLYDDFSFLIGASVADARSHFA